jgi:TonB family protein
MTRRALLATLAILGSLALGAGPAARKPKVTAYFAPGFTDTAWQKEARDRIVKAWKPVKLPAPGKKTVVITIVGKDGKIVGARDNMLSGDAAWDKAAFDAVRGASPLPPLPKEWPHGTLEVHWHFETGT